MRTWILFIVCCTSFALMAQEGEEIAMSTSIGCKRCVGPDCHEACDGEQCHAGCYCTAESCDCKVRPECQKKKDCDCVH